MGATLGAAAAISGVIPYVSLTPLDIRAIEDSVIQFTTAQALIDNIGHNQNGDIVIRDILGEESEASYKLYKWLIDNIP